MIDGKIAVQAHTIICYLSLGDNIDTAISVARECNMIDQGHKVVMLQATDNGDSRGISLNYTLVGDEGGLDDPIASYTDSFRELCNDSLKVKCVVYV